MTISVVLAAGGTAGHVNPMLATARAFDEIGADVCVHAVGTAEGMEVRLVGEAGIDLHTISRVPMPRKITPGALSFPIKFRRAVHEAADILERVDAQVVVGFGGYVSTPVYLAARRRSIPVIVHEGNARPGMANKVGARFAKVVALTFANTQLAARHGLTETIGLPMRSMITDMAQEPGGRTAYKKEYARIYGLDPEQPIVVVTGGSSGAQHINEVVAQAAGDFAQAGIQVLHLTGRGKSEAVHEALGSHDAGTYVVLEYLEHMDHAYALADLVITRAGAGMVAEVSALGIPAVFVPLPIGNGEQALNAHDVVSAGGALLVKNENFTPRWVNDQVIPLFHGNRLSAMADRAMSVSALDAAQRLAKLTLEVAR